MTPDHGSQAPALNDETYRCAFRSTPSACALLDVDLRLVDVNSAFVALTGRDPATLLGRELLEAFPNNPDAADTDPAASVRASLLRARDTKAADVLTELRYDLAAGDGFAVRYWNITNVPVLDADQTLLALLNRIEDVTDVVTARAARDRAEIESAQLQTQVAAAQADLMDRATELQRLNSRLRVSNEHDRDVAAALQSAMLPRLPEPDHLHLVGRYLTASGTDQVGGDWYDAIVSTSGGTTLMIGDVVGHDINAAALMGQLRSMLRAFTWDYQEPPSRIVTLLDRSMRDLDIKTLATLTVVSIDQTAADADDGSRTLRWTNAGHPPPVLLLPDGHTERLDRSRRELLLGVTPDTERTDHTDHAPPGSTLLLYTDGLIETRRHDIDDRIDALSTSLSEHRALPTEELVDALITDMVGDHPDDDVALLAVRFLPQDQPRPAAAGPAHL